MKVLDAFYSGKIKAVVHKKILEEYEDVLSRPKFDLDKDNVKRTINSFSKTGVFLDGIPSADEVKDKKDIVFYEVALDAKAHFESAYLVTGNQKHYPIRPIVVSPAEMIKIIEGGE